MLNKADLSPGAAASASLTEAEAQAWRTERLSALNLADVARLQTTLASHVAERLSGAEFPGSTRLRHRDA
ncbi:hypothetical protein LAN33_27180, partial [Mycobacterium tuberculosis]|nr:hypothetical protein [Mycobacterium tuberculosis]